MTTSSGTQPRFFWLDLNDLIPQDHLLRKIKDAIDFRFIYDKVAHLYSKTGRPSVDPVIMFKMLLVGYLYGIPSERRLVQEVRLHLAYRWFVGLQLDDPVPDHSTFSQNRRRRFKDTGVFREIFDHVVQLCIEKGLVSGKLVVTDSTAIKANVTVGKNETTAVEPAYTPQEYLNVLDEAVERAETELKQRRGIQGGDSTEEGDTSKPRSGVKLPEPREVKVSQTDPDARFVTRPGKELGYYYRAHQTIDSKHGIIVDAHATRGNLPDHIPFAQRLPYVQEKHGLSIESVAADAAYDEGFVHYVLVKRGIKGFIARKTKRGPAKTFRKDLFAYDADLDVYWCPAGHQLLFNHISHTNAQKVYMADPSVCRNCPLRAQCVSGSARARVVTRPFLQDDADVNHRYIGTEEYAQAQRKRRTLAEGTFGLQKRLHNLARARMRGLQRIEEQVLLSATAVNLKRMVMAIG